MDKPKGYDDLKVGQRSENQALPITAYVCKILNAKDDVTLGGDNVLDVMFDIAEGEYTNFFAKKFQKTKELKEAGQIESTPKWSGKIRLFCPMNSDFESTDPARKSNYKKRASVVKGFFTSVEQSNAGYVYNFTDTKYATLQGKYVGIVFNEDNYKGYSFPKAVLAVSSDVARKMQEGELALPIFNKNKQPKQDEGQKIAEDYKKFTEKSLSDKDLPF
jgi:hypothetical protein